MIVGYIKNMKKSSIGIIILFLITQNAFSQSRVVADISNLKNNKGVCRACLFNNPASFKGETGDPFQCVAVVIKNLSAQAVFNNVPAGTFAMFVFHDANSNNKMDINFLGIPKEGYGASNNKLPFASAPAYNDNKFVVADKSLIKLKVKMRNL
jgi:uncharacterized protein (DUF2141 family)